MRGYGVMLAEEPSWGADFAPDPALADEDAWRVLLALHFDERIDLHIHDGGAVHVLAPVADLAAGRYDRTVCSVASGWLRAALDGSAAPDRIRQQRYSADRMWDERISVVRAFADAITARDVEAALELCHPEIEFFSLLAQLEATPYRGFAGIRRYFEDIEATWAEWRVEVERLSSAPDGRVVIVMSTHMRGSGSGLPFAQRVANLWEFRDEKLWRATLYRDPADALRAIEMPPLGR